MRRTTNVVVTSIVPVFVGAVLAFTTWVAVSVLRAEQVGLTRDDEIRMVSELHGYTDQQVGALRQDIGHVRADLSEIRGVQTEILLELKRSRDNQ